MTQQAPSQPFGFADDYIAEETPPTQPPLPVNPSNLTVSQRLFALEQGQAAMMRILTELRPEVKRLRLESKLAQYIKRGGLVAVATAVGNIVIAQLPGAKAWVPSIIEAIRVFQ